MRLIECLACFRHRQIFTGYIMQNPTAGIPPAIMSVKDACQWSHLSRSEVNPSTRGWHHSRGQTFAHVRPTGQPAESIANLPAAKFHS